MENSNITTAELKDAYYEAKLWRDGISFQKAINTPLLLRALTNQVIFRRDLAQSQKPRQGDLFRLEAIA